MQLLGEGAIEQVSTSRRDGWFVQPPFGVPRREGGLCPILDLGPINRALGKCSFRMLTLSRSWCEFAPGTGLRPWIKGRVLSHSDSTVSQMGFWGMLSTVKEKHSVPILCSPVRAALAPRTFKVLQCCAFSSDRVEGASSTIWTIGWF